MVRAMGENNIHIVQLKAFKRFLRSFDDAIRAGDIGSQRSAFIHSGGDSSRANSLFPRQTHVVRPAAAPKQFGGNDEIRTLHVQFLEDTTPGKIPHLNEFLTKECCPMTSVETDISISAFPEAYPSAVSNLSKGH